MTYQPAAFESVLDSIKGVSTHGFFFFNCVMLVTIGLINFAAYRRLEWLIVIQRKRDFVEEVSAKYESCQLSKEQRAQAELTMVHVLINQLA